ncbi:MAG: hypothetical protein AABY11_01650, partial [archaeon]
MERLELIARLEDFNKEMVELSKLSFIPKMQGSGLNIRYDKGKGIQVQTRFPEDEAIKAICNDIRKFIQENDSLGIKKLKEVYSSEIVPIQNFVQGCLDETLESAVFDIAEKGGYDDPSKIPSTELLDVPYYIKNNENLMPSKEKIQEEISKSVEENL